MRRKYKVKRVDLIFISIVVSAIISLISVMIIGIKMKPILIEIARVETSKLESTIVNNAINEMIVEGYSTDSLFEIVEAKDGIIQMIDFNSTRVNEFLSILTIKVQDSLKKLEDGVMEDLGITKEDSQIENELNLKKGILVEVPLGASSNNPLLSNLGAKIPIKMHYLGDINSTINTKITEYGINNALMEITANVKLNAKIMLPFLTDKITLKTSVPIVIKMIQGQIPTYYGNNISKDSLEYSLPLE